MNVQDVQAAVAMHFRVPLYIMLSRKRNREYVRARMLAMYLARKHTRASLPALAKAFEHHHTSVMHAITRVPEIALINREYAEAITQIEARLGVA